MIQQQHSPSNAGSSVQPVIRVRPVAVNDLLLDHENPRLPRFDKPPSQDELLALMIRNYSVGELIESFAINGYFDEEPLVAIPALDDPGKFIVVEGNRRLVALILLLNPDRAKAFRISAPTVDEARLQKLKQVPVLVHQTRAEVLPYLGYRHITGVMVWDSYSKARYIAQLVHQGEDLQAIQRRIGDRHETAPRLFRAYLVWEQVDGEGLLARNGHAPPFSYLFTALTFRPVLDYLGLVAQGVPRPVDEDHKPQLRELTTYLYGNKQTGRKAAIKESRQIKDLAQALASHSGREKLQSGGDAQEALDAVPSEEARLERTLRRASDALVQAIGLAPRHRTNDSLGNLARDCLRLAQRLHRAFGGR